MAVIFGKHLDNRVFAEIKNFIPHRPRAAVINLRPARAVALFQAFLIPEIQRKQVKVDKRRIFPLCDAKRQFFIIRQFYFDFMRIDDIFIFGMFPHC